MSLIALPLVVGATREALQSIPAHVREASYALGKDKISTIRRVLLPASRKGIATGTTLGMGRIAGDTAIVVILLGASLTLEKQGSTPVHRHAQGNRQHPDQLRLQQLPRRRGQRPAEGLCGCIRPADDRDRHELRRRPDLTTKGVIHGPAEESASRPPHRGGRRSDDRRAAEADAMAPRRRSRTLPPACSARRASARASAARSRSACETEELGVAYAGKPAVKGVNLSVNEGEVLA